MQYVNTKYQLADILTKGSFSGIAWSNLCELCSLGPKIENANTNQDVIWEGYEHYETDDDIFDTFNKQMGYLTKEKPRIIGSHAMFAHRSFESSAYYRKCLFSDSPAKSHKLHCYLEASLH